MQSGRSKDFLLKALLIFLSIVLAGGVYLALLKTREFTQNMFMEPKDILFVHPFIIDFSLEILLVIIPSSIVLLTIYLISYDKMNDVKLTFRMGAGGLILYVLLIIANIFNFYAVTEKGVYVQTISAFKKVFIPWKSINKAEEVRYSQYIPRKHFESSYRHHSINIIKHYLYLKNNTRIEIPTSYKIFEDYDTASSQKLDNIIISKNITLISDY